MLLSIIIVSYNTRELTAACLASVWAEIEASSSLSRQNCQVIVIDNNSSDGSVEMAQSQPVKLIKNQTNVGFAAANNQGLATATGEYLLLLNSDTELQTGSLDALLAAFSNHPTDPTTAHLTSHHGQLDRLGILAAALYNPDGSYQPQGGSFPTLLTLAIHMLGLDDIPLLGRLLPSTQHTGRGQSQPPTQLLTQKDWVAATAMMTRRATLEETGPLDQNIFMYGEDVELCVRARAHHWDVALHRDARVMHRGSASSGSERAIIGELQGYLYIWSKHKPLWQVPIAKLLLKTGCLLRAAFFGILKKPQAAWYRHALSEL